MKQQRVLFLTLYTFSLTGGIEKVCRNLFHVLDVLLSQKKLGRVKMLSMYDSSVEKENFSAFEGNKIKFGVHSFFAGLKADVVVLSHINLLIFAKIILFFGPKKRIILIAHGIEVWNKLPKWKVNFLSTIEIWAVSRFTARELERIHQIPNKSIKIVNNSLSLDIKPLHKTRPEKLIKRYQIKDEEKVLLTICRLSSAEKYKGYDQVLLALNNIKDSFPNIRYFIVGKADQNEQERIQKLIADYHLEENVICTGFVSDSDLIDFYQLADIFAMPSLGEGFGLVFIEAAYYGCNLIAGNQDGSTDALLDGDLGLLVDPKSSDAIGNALIHLIKHPLSDLEIDNRRKKVVEHFGIEKYTEHIFQLLETNPN